MAASGGHFSAVGPWELPMRSIRSWKTVAILSAVLAALIAVPVVSAAAADRGPVRAVVRDVNNAFLGVVTLVPEHGKLVVAGSLSGLAQGFHGFHVHSVGRCEPQA